MSQPNTSASPTHALVVEGGAMRGIFAAGVLDHFLDENYHPFDRCIGVSAGSTNLAGYLTGQRGRSYTIITDYSCRSDFFSLRNYLKGGHYINLDWLWAIARDEYELDSAAYAAQPVPLEVVTTDVNTGLARYTVSTGDSLEADLLASCAVPMAYRHYPTIDGEPQTDGGVADSIPVIRAYESGARQITVICSRAQGYRKRPPRFPQAVRRLFRSTPVLAEAMIRRHIAYNRAVDFLENPPADCDVKVIYPPESFRVSRTTTDLGALNAGYEAGIKAGQSLVQGDLQRAHKPHEPIGNDKSIKSVSSS
ncbi:patatin-like phospholipase family protein [Reinekea blandensis]|uniref:PNPLA domain-containing protein n=1 Tax=Reinekea blandensis MED297 TaxID=314283 RepID=A4BCB5_9GAMM|nr:patatin family protein [Reinekea blandensis]EAR10181.1 hypothetical protein MED297_13197 [Reinekea sp. MED297] [Reinekea blandensis MED297]